jgi:hypothetical protein
MVDGNKKGKAFERKICQEFTLLFGMSMKFKRDIEQFRQSDLGDIICSDPEWPFIVECKRYAKGNGPQPAWIRQAQRAADTAKKHWAVVYQYDRKPVRVAVSLAALADAMGNKDFHKETIWESDLEGFAEIVREIMARVHEKRQLEKIYDRTIGV